MRRIIFVCTVVGQIFAATVIGGNPAIAVGFSFGAGFGLAMHWVYEGLVK